MVEACKEFFTKYATFSGRTSRKTFWLTILDLLIVSFVIQFIAGLIFGIPNSAAVQTVEELKAYFANGYVITQMVWDLIVFIPSLALTVRRLHDINKSGWWFFISFVPFVGGIILFVFTVLPAVEEGNKY